MAGKLVVPARAFNDKVVVGFMNRILDGINAVLPATLTAAGIVKLAAVSTDATASTVSVDTVDAPTQTGSYVQADVQAIADLANEIKADVNTLTNDVNALKDSLNDLKAKMRTAGQLDT